MREDINFHFSTSLVNFFTLGSLCLYRSSTTYQYSFSRNLKPSSDSSGDATPIFPRAPTMTVVEKTDDVRKGNLGFKLDVADAKDTANPPAQGSSCGCEGTTKDFECEPDVKAHVEIKDSDGRVVHQDDAPLSQFAFG